MRLCKIVHSPDGWQQIEVKGNHLNRKTGLIHVIDDEALRIMTERFNAEAAQPNFSGMLVAQEEFKHVPLKETLAYAYGWLMKLQSRVDGLYGQIRWTATGLKAVDGGEYRFLSAEYDPVFSCDTQILASIPNPENPGGNLLKQIRPLLLTGLTLANFYGKDTN